MAYNKYVNLYTEYLQFVHDYGIIITFTTNIRERINIM
jgi:hypothetical protein